MGNLGIKKCDHDLPLFHKSKRGQALVETAITAIILLPLLLGLVDVGRLIYTKIVITNAAREGAYYLSYNPSNIADSQQAVINEAQNSLVTVTSVSTSCPCTLDNPITVTVTAALNGILLRNITVTSNYVIMMVVQ